MRKRSVTALIIVTMTGVGALLAGIVAAIVWRAPLLRDVQDDE
jgi:hypothetical protein